MQMIFVLQINVLKKHYNIITWYKVT